MGNIRNSSESSIRTDPLTQINLEYPVKSIPRYGFGNEPHKLLYKLINDYRTNYNKVIDSTLGYNSDLLKISTESQNSTDPYWNNFWFQGLDASTLYTLIREYEPHNFIEIGSGNSTKFARRAINDGNLSTQIISIDPQPRAKIDSICDSIIRYPFEDVDLGILEKLSSGDMLFMDSSHRVFMNSDVTSFFLDVMPFLKSGVLVHFHDILLPYDYPVEWAERFYSEQYMLAVYLLTRKDTKIIFPSCFVHNDPILKNREPEIFSSIKNAEVSGCSFWIEI